MLSILEDLAFTALPPNDISKYTNDADDNNCGNNEKQISQNDESVLESADRLNARCHAILHLPYVSSQMGSEWTIIEIIPYLLRCIEEDEPLLSFVVGAALIELTTTFITKNNNNNNGNNAHETCSGEEELELEQETVHEKPNETNSQVCVSLEDSLPVIVALCGSHDEHIRHFASQVVIPHICFGVPLHVENDFTMWEAQYCPFLLSVDERLLNNSDKNKSSNNNLQTYKFSQDATCAMNTISHLQFMQELALQKEITSNNYLYEHQLNKHSKFNENVAFSAQKWCDEEMELTRENDKYIAIHGYFTESAKQKIMESEKQHKSYKEQHPLMENVNYFSPLYENEHYNISVNIYKKNNISTTSSESSIQHKSNTITEIAYRQIYGMSPSLLSSTPDISEAVLCSRWLLHSIRLWIANSAHWMHTLEIKRRSNTHKEKSKENSISPVVKEKEAVHEKEKGKEKDIKNEKDAIQTTSDANRKNHNNEVEQKMKTDNFTTKCISMNDYLENKSVREALRARWKFAMKVLELLLTSQYGNAKEVGVEFLALIMKALSYAQVHWRSYECSCEKEVENHANVMDCFTNKKESELLFPFAFALPFIEVKEVQCHSSRQLNNFMQEVMYKHVAVVCAVAHFSSYRLESIWHDFTQRIIPYKKIEVKMFVSMETAWMQAKSELFTLLIQHNYLLPVHYNNSNKEDSLNKNNVKLLDTQGSKWLCFGTGPTEIDEHSTLTCDVCDLSMEQSCQSRLFSVNMCASFRIKASMLPYLPYLVDWNKRGEIDKEQKLIRGLSVQNVVMLLTSSFIPTKNINEYKSYAFNNNTQSNDNLELLYEEESYDSEWWCDINLSRHVLMKQLLFAASRLSTETAFVIHHKWNNACSDNTSSISVVDDDDEEVYEEVESLLNVMFIFVQRVCTVLALSPAWKVRWELFHQLPFICKSFLHLLLTPAQVCMEYNYCFLNRNNKENMEGRFFTTLKMIKLSQRYVQEFITFQQQLWQMVEDQSHNYAKNDDDDDEDDNDNYTQNSIMCLCALNDNENEVRCVALESTCNIAELCTQATLRLSECMNTFTIMQEKNLCEEFNERSISKEITDMSLLHLLLLQLITTLCKVTRNATFLSIGAYYNDDNKNSKKKSSNNSSSDEYKICCSSASSLANLTQFVYMIKSIPLFSKYHIDKEWNWLKESLLTVFAPLLTMEHVSSKATDSQISTYSSSNDNETSNENCNVVELTLIQKYTDLLLLMCIDKFEITAQLKVKEHLQEEEEKHQIVKNNSNEGSNDEINDLINVHLKKLVKYLEQLSQHKLWRLREQYVWLLSWICYKFMSSYCALQQYYYKRDKEEREENEDISEEKQLLQKKGKTEIIISPTSNWSESHVQCFMWLYNFALEHFVPLLVNVMFDKTHVIRTTALNATRQLCVALEELCTKNSNTQLCKQTQTKTPKLPNAKEEEEKDENVLMSTNAINNDVKTQSKTIHNFLHKHETKSVCHNHFNDYQQENEMKKKTHHVKHRTFAERVIWPALKHNPAAWSCFSHRVALLQIVLSLELNKKHVLMPLLEKLSMDKVVNVRMAVAKTIYTLLQRSHASAQEGANTFHERNNTNCVYTCSENIMNSKSNKVVLSKSDRNGLILRIVRSLLADSSSDVRDEAARAIAICY